MLAEVALVPGAQRRTRASKSRVKSGCKTCKVRRIKCDEGHPVCYNCLRVKRDCHYEKGTPGRKWGSRPLVVQYRPIAPNSTIPEISSVIRQPNASLFATEEECRYFNLFREKTASALAGYFNTSLWDRTVLQSCESNPAIRACVIAIGALDQTLDTTQRKLAEKAWRANGTTADVVYLGTTHHEFALRQYGRAIRELKESLSTKQSDIRSALIVCMLTVCFEALNGDMQSAITQVRNGLRLIREYLPPGTAAIAARLGSIGETHEIIQAFDRLDNDSVVTQDAEPIDFTIETGATTPDDAMERMPPVFKTVEEAKVYYEFILNQFLHWIAFQYAWGSRERNESEHRLPASVGKVSVTEQRKKYLKAFSQWYCAFQPLLASSSSKGEKDLIAATALDCRFKSLDAANNVNHFLGEMGYDEVTPKFQEVVNLARKLAVHETELGAARAAKFAFEGAIISSSYAVALKCRDRSVRRQAIAILESRPRREGVFDSALQAKLARIQMDIEESETVGDIIPEHSRIRGIKTTCDMMKREGHMKYLKMDPETSGFTYKHLDFTW